METRKIFVISNADTVIERENLVSVVMEPYKSPKRASEGVILYVGLVRNR